MKALTYVEIDVPKFAQPMAVFDANIFQNDIFQVESEEPDSPEVLETFRFAYDTDYLPNEIDCIPSIRKINIRPSIISLGTDLGQRAAVTITFRDHRHQFASEDFDSGTFWGKFRARHGVTLRGRSLRLIRGMLGDAIESMETRHYFIEDTNGPTVGGEFTIVAKDVLKAADDERAQAPLLSEGFLLAAIDEDAVELELSPPGVGEDYGDDGYVVLSGREIAQYHRDSVTVSLLHFDGADGTFSFTDTAMNEAPPTRDGDAEIDTAQSKFGGASGLFQGSGDYITYPARRASDFHFPGDLTIEFWLRRNAIGTNQNIWTQDPSSEGITILFNTSNHVLVFVKGVGILSSSPTTIGAGGAFTHVAVTKSGTTWRLFINGTQVHSVANSDNLTAATATRIGANFVVSQFYDGWIDELRVSRGTAHYTAGFTPAASAFTLGPFTGDVLRLTIRGAFFNTEVTSHDANSRAQIPLVYEDQDVADILYDLWVNYAFVDPDFIILANWQAETAAYLGGSLYSAFIGNPVAVHKLVSELIQQAALVHWWDDVAQQLKLQVLRPISTAADTFTPENYLMNSLEYQEQPNKRVSQVWTYFGILNPLINLDQEDNYRATAVLIDSDAENEYGSPAIKKIFSRWIPVDGRGTADALNVIQLARYRDPPRRIKFDVLRDSVNTPALAVGYQLEGYPFQELDGTAASVPIQITSLVPGDAIIEAEAEEALYFNFTPSSPDIRTLTIETSQNNYNLANAFQSAYGTPTAGLTVTCIIPEGVIVGSSSEINPAFHVGDWSVAVTLIVRVRGRIQGAGGDGGHDNGGDGNAGGTALYTRENITLDLTTGDAEIWGGGGGGGGSDESDEGSSGSGGAGTVPGAAGPAPAGGQLGFAGTSEAGGATPPEGDEGGGAGGNPGQAGSASTDAQGAGGAGGIAIDGISFVTKNGTGDILGSEVN